MADDVGSLLLRAGLVAPGQLEAARLNVEKHGGTVPEELVRRGHLDDEELTSFYRNRLLIPRVNPSELAKLTARLLEKVPADMAAELRAIPVALDGEGNLTLVMSDPSDTKAIDEITFFTGSYVMRAIATQAQIAWCLAHYYKQKTALYDVLVAEGQWPDTTSTGARGKEAGKGMRSSETDFGEGETGPMTAHEPRGPDDLDEGETGPMQILKPREPGELDEGETGPMQIRKPKNKPQGSKRRERSPTESAETGPLRVRKRPKDQRPSPPELFARAGEITTIDRPNRNLEAHPAVVVALAEDAEAPRGGSEEQEQEQRAIVREEQRGTDTAPFLLSAAKKTPDPRERQSGPIILERRRQRRNSRRTSIGMGALGTEKPTPMERALAEQRQDLAAPIAADTAPGTGPSPRTTDMVKDDTWGKPGSTIPPAYLGAAPAALRDVAEAVPVAVEEDVTSQLRASEPAGTRATAPMGVATLPTVEIALPKTPGTPGKASPADQSVPVPVDPAGDATVRSDAPAEVRHTSLAEAASTLLSALRHVDKARSKDEVIEPLLSVLDGAFERTGFLALRQDDLVAWRLHGCPNDAKASLCILEDSSFKDAVRTRLPYNGPVEDEISKKLCRDLDAPDALDLLALPITIRERVIGVLFGLGSHGKIYEEHVSVLSQAAGEALERILLAKT